MQPIVISFNSGSVLYFGAAGEAHVVVVVLVSSHSGQPQPVDGSGSKASITGSGGSNPRAKGGWVAQQVATAGGRGPRWEASHRNPCRRSHGQ